MCIYLTNVPDYKKNVTILTEFQGKSSGIVPFFKRKKIKIFNIKCRILLVSNPKAGGILMFFIVKWKFNNYLYKNEQGVKLQLIDSLIHIYVT